MKLRVVVIDDEESIRNTFKWYLQDLGHEVIVADNPTPIVKLISGCESRESPCADVYFVDQNMPEMTGLEFFEHSCFNHCKLPPCNKILMSGSLTQDVIEGARKVECKTVNKPVTLLLVDELINDVTKKMNSERVLANLK